MDLEPHTHHLKVGPLYNTSESHALKVTYGDTMKVLYGATFLPFLDWRITRAARRVIAKHDRGTLRAAKAKQDQAEMQAHLNETLVGKDTQTWASKR